MSFWWAERNLWRGWGLTSRIRECANAGKDDDHTKQTTLIVSIIPRALIIELSPRLRALYTIGWQPCRQQRQAACPTRGQGASKEFNKHAQIAGRFHGSFLSWRQTVCFALLIATSRRKKAKCSGERPVCEHCKRLGQDCQWESAGGARSSSTSDPQDSGGVRAVSTSESANGNGSWGGSGSGIGSGFDQGNARYDVSSPTVLASDRETDFISMLGWHGCAGCRD